MGYTGNCVRCGIPARRETLDGPAICGWCSGDHDNYTTTCASCHQTLRQADPAAGGMDLLNSDPEICLQCR